MKTIGDVFRKICGRPNEKNAGHNREESVGLKKCETDFFFFFFVIFSRTGRAAKPRCVDGVLSESSGKFSNFFFF